ncbi:MAG: type I secretion protein TolC [Alphaproteobacteria bacterium]|nr:type I secretion protein TolC [Alphaproteobacteria bacterium]
MVTLTRTVRALLMVSAAGTIFFSGEPVSAKEKPKDPPSLETAIAEASGEFSLRDALYLTYMQNPTVLAARSELLGTQEELPQALAGWKPVIDAGISVTAGALNSEPDSVGDGSTSKEIEFTVLQPVYSGGSTIAATDAAMDTIRAQRAALESVEQAVLLQAATAYMAVIQDKAILMLAEANRDVIARQLEATRARFDVGELTRTDVSQAEARVAEAESLITRSVADLRASEATFVRITGAEPGDCAHPEIDIFLPGTLDEALATAEDVNPLIAAAEYTHLASTGTVDVIFGELLPHVDLFGSWTQTRDPQPGLLEESTVGAIGLTASVPLYEAGSVRSRVRQAKHTANQLRMGIVEQTRAVRQSVISAWEALAAARAEIRSRSAQVDAAEIARDGVYQEMELGTRTVLDALDADQEVLDARVALVTAQTNEVVAAYTLARSVGLLTASNLGFPKDPLDADAHLHKIKWAIFDTGIEEPVGQIGGEL